MADYTKQIFEMLGVEPEEEFKTRHRIYNSDQQLYKIDRKLNVFGFYSAEWIELDETHLLQMLLNGDAKIIKIPHPTAEEQLAINYARACGCKWIAKDKDKTVTAFKEKPYKNYKESAETWINPTFNRSDWMELHLPISFLSWEDEEPFYIGD